MSEQILSYIDWLDSHIKVHVAKGETLHLQLASFKDFHDTEILATVEEGGTLIAAYCDFSSGSGHFSFKGELLGPHSFIEWHLASLLRKSDVRFYQTEVTHKATDTTALVSNYGIARDKSHLSFRGASTIPVGAKKTNTRQVAKIIVFDKEADGEASPSLIINDNDVIASHAASVGRLSSEHLFYLQSRGISLEDAKRLIAFGYLKPIASFFNDQRIKEKIAGFVEGGI